METQKQETVVNSKGQTVYKGKWGYYPCDYETFLKLKELNKAYNKAQRQAKAWHRWARKAEHNRKGKEPLIDKPFCETVLAEKVKTIMSYMPRTCRSFFIKEGDGYVYCDDYWNINKNHNHMIVVRGFNIEAAYKEARTPRESPDEVIPMVMPEGQIIGLFKDLGT